MRKDRTVSNPGSALGEAIGILMEMTLNEVLGALAEEKGRDSRL